MKGKIKQISPYQIVRETKQAIGKKGTTTKCSGYRKLSKIINVSKSLTLTSALASALQ